MAKRSKLKPSNVSFDYKEGVIDALVGLTVPRRIAEIAVIDLSLPLKKGFHGKKLPSDTAKKMLKDVCRVYTSEDVWHYEHGPCSIVCNAVVSKTKNVGSIPTKGANFGEST